MSAHKHRNADKGGRWAARFASRRRRVRPEWPMNSLTSPTATTPSPEPAPEPSEESRTEPTGTGHAQGFPQSRKTSQIVPSTGAVSAPASTGVPRETSSEPATPPTAAAADTDIPAGQGPVPAEEPVASAVPAQADHHEETAAPASVTEVPAHHGDTVNLALAAEEDRSVLDQDGAPDVPPPAGGSVPTRLEPTTFPRPHEPRVMVVANQKGGVGKTTTTVNLAVALARGGLRVLVIDLDPQGNASTALAVEHGRDAPSVYDALVEGTPLDQLALPATESDNLWVVPANVDLAGAEIELVSVVARENRLRKALMALPELQADSPERLDYVLIDCPPSLGLLTLNALVAAQEMIVPIQAEYYALEGVGQLLETVELVRANLNPELDISTVLMTMYDARTRLSAAVADEVRAHFGERVLRTSVPRSVRVSEAPSFGQSVLSYDPTSPGALSYLEVAREVATRLPVPAAATSGGVR